ncbi:hypothetical protein QN397_22670 [Variovorax sp. RTB1]|uniref:hypothetical protein n=1 Tax=Variovorax sp. RTB1 TaxID=3048631 RepID=UPI002B231CD7|nr:hypothetical protein [Variovorax sp. RTB1]MEB0114097.1 hypothetical protein [Variovorax sp. RTB1]
MTAQVPERLQYEGHTLALCTEPLASYLSTLSPAPAFRCFMTALTRAYQGTWAIEDGRLYLVELHGMLQDETHGDLLTVFPNAMGKVFADWYTGTLRAPLGERLKYVHMDFRSIYEEDLLINVKQGAVTTITTRRNSKPPEEPKPTFAIPDFLLK